MQVSFKTYRDAFPLRWTVFWLLVPNLAIILMWFVGGPPMTPALTLFGFTGLALAQFPWTWVKRLGLVAMIAELTYYYVCVLFNLDTSNIAMLPPFIEEVRPLHSPEYVIAALVFVTAVIVSLVCAPRVPRFSTAMSYILGFCMVFALVTVDFAATASTRGSYHRQAPDGAPFASAAEATGASTPSPARHNVVFVVVEALGMPVDPTARAIFARDWDRQQWRARYDVRHGLIDFYGATTNGEMRELCGQWANYNTVNFTQADCLPARYARGGYETSAFHSFTGSLFDRERWYPKAGFQHMIFAKDLFAKGVSQCPGVFPGACDAGVPPMILAKLEHAKRPQLIYWMTLNTHLPVVADSALHTDKCALGSPDWAEANPQVCRLFLLHEQLANALDRIAMAPNLPPTDFVIVGDHMPPFFDRESRLMFDNTHVPWIYLRARDGVRVAAPQLASR